MFEGANIEDNDPNFLVDESGTAARIKIIGVGGGGGNAVNNMFRQNIEGVSYVVLNTDKMGNTTPDSFGFRERRMPITRPSTKPMATGTAVKKRCSSNLVGRS